MRAQQTLRSESLRTALCGAPFVGFTLLVDDDPRPGETSSQGVGTGSKTMFNASFVLPSSAIINALSRAEALLAQEAENDKNPGPLFLLFESPDGLESMLPAAFMGTPLAPFSSSSAWANIHLRSFWTIQDQPADKLIGAALSYYGSGSNGILKQTTFYSRDAFSQLWRHFASRLSSRFGLAQSPDIIETLVLAPNLMDFHRSMPAGLCDNWRALAQRELLLEPMSHVETPARRL